MIRKASVMLFSVLVSMLIVACQPTYKVSGTPFPHITPLHTPYPLQSLTPPNTPLPAPTVEIGPQLPAGAQERIGIGVVYVSALSPDRKHLALGTTAGVAVLNSETLDQQWFTLIPGIAAGVAWSPDGSKLAMWPQTPPSSGIYILDADSGTLSGMFSENGVITNVVWSPDGSTLAAGITNYETSEIFVALFDPSGRELGKLNPPSGAAGIGRVAWSPTGSPLAATTHDGKIVLWRMPEAEIERVISLPDSWGVSDFLEFDAQGTMLATRDSPSFLWNVESGEAVTLADPPEYIYPFGWSPDGEKLLIGSSDGWEIWAPKSRSRALPIDLGGSGESTGFAWSPDSSGLIVATYFTEEGYHFFEAEVWTAAGEQPVGFGLDHSFSNMLWVDQNRMIIAAGDRVLLVDDFLDEAQTTRVITWHALSDMQWSSDGSTLIDLPEPPEIGDTEEVHTLSASPDGKLVAVLLYDGFDSSEELSIYEAAASEPILTLNATDYEDEIVWSPDSKKLVLKRIEQATSQFEVLDVRDGSKITTIPISGDAVLAWSSDSKQVAVGAADGLGIFDATSGVLLRTLPGLAGQVGSIDWSPDGNWIAAGGMRQIQDGLNIAVWDARTGELKHLLTATPYKVLAVQWSPDSTRLAAGGYDPLHIGGWQGHEVIVWEMQSATPIASFWGHSEPVTGLWWSPDGKRLASAASNGMIFIWNAPD